jgi:hypothetical protein
MATERGSLGLGQRLVLLAAWLVSCGFVYVLGLYVGKGMRGGGEITPRVALPVEATVPAPPPVEAQAPLTFYDVLGSREGSAPPPRPAEARPPQPSGLNEQKLPPAAAPAVVAPAATPAPAIESVKSAPGVAPVASPPPAAPGLPATAAVAERPSAVQMPNAKPAVPAAPPAGVGAPPAVAAVPPAGTATLPPQAASGRWTVYASPTRDRLAVEHERAALRAKGYPAEVVTLRRDGDTWYRIRVGRYATQTQAEDASRRLRSDGVGHAFVQSE